MWLFEDVINYFVISSFFSSSLLGYPLWDHCCWCFFYRVHLKTAESGKGFLFNLRTYPLMDPDKEISKIICHHSSIDMHRGCYVPRALRNISERVAWVPLSPDRWGIYVGSNSVQTLKDFGWGSCYLARQAWTRIGTECCVCCLQVGGKLWNPRWGERHHTPGEVLKLILKYWYSLITVHKKEMR